MVELIHSRQLVGLGLGVLVTMAVVLPLGSLLMLWQLICLAWEKRKSSKNYLVNPGSSTGFEPRKSGYVRAGRLLTWGTRDNTTTQTCSGKTATSSTGKSK